MTDDPSEADAFLAAVAGYQRQHPGLTPVQAGMLAAAALDIARDSRTFARLLGISHALVLRELNAFADDGGPLRIVRRDERTLRTHYALVDEEPSGNQSSVQ